LIKIEKLLSEGNLNLDLDVTLKNPYRGPIPTTDDGRDLITRLTNSYLDAIQTSPLDAPAHTITLIVVDHRRNATRQLTAIFQRLADTIPRGFVWIADRNGRLRCHAIVPLARAGNVNGEAGDGNANGDGNGSV
jgi:hypothetical protein